MRAEVLDEPQLEFGGGGRHVDPRFGITAHGPADLNVPGAPTAIRIGLVGPADQLDGLRQWLERCREPIPAKDERYPHLFPSFPGCDIDRGLFTTLVFSDRNTRQVPERPLRGLANRSGTEPVNEAVDLYVDELASLAEENRVDLILVARPDQLQDTRKRRRGGYSRGQRPPKPKLRWFPGLILCLSSGDPSEITRHVDTRILVTDRPDVRESRHDTQGWRDARGDLP